MKKRLSAGLLAAFLSAGALFFGTGGAAATSGDHAVLSIAVDPETFRDVTTMCCYIYDKTDETDIVQWGSRNGKMTQSSDASVWRFDLGEHGVALDSAHSYCVVFSDNWNTQTEGLALSDYDSAREYTAVFSEIYTRQSMTSKPVFLYKWRGENDENAGVDCIRVYGDEAAFGIDSTLYCEVYDETDAACILWYGRMTKEPENHTWSFDFGRHGLALVNGHRYTIIFNGAMPLTIDCYNRSACYTAAFTGVFAEDEAGNRRPLFRWSDAQTGDADGNGKVTIQDVTDIQRYLAELEALADKQLAAADANGDGKINISDATHLQKYLAEFKGIVLGKPNV